jgi:hypothetical protein
VRSARGGHRPRKAPAVAMEHRQRPQVDRVMPELCLDHLTERVEVRAAVGVDDALRAPGGAGGVVDRDRLLLVGQPRRHAGCVAATDELLIGASRAAIVDADDLQARWRVHDQRFELGASEQHPRPGVLEDVADLVGAQARVDRNEDAARRRHRVMQLEQCGHVRTQGRDAVATLEPSAAQRGGRAVHPLAQLGIRPAAVTVDDGDALGMHGGAAVQERDGIELGTAHSRARRPRRLRHRAVALDIHGNLLQDRRRYAARRPMATGVSSAP